VALEFTDASLRRRIALVAENSARVVPTGHAKKRMRERKVSRSQVLRVLQGGEVYEPAHRNIKGNWQCTLRRVVAGDAVRVACSREHDEAGELVVAITVIN